MSASMLITKSIGKDEVYCNWYVCPNCKEEQITACNNYCPMCGKELAWPDNPLEIEGYEK